MKLSVQVCVASFVYSLVLPAIAQEGVLHDNEGDIPKEIRVKARKNPGNLGYRFFVDGQKKLQGFLPPEPRMLDMMFRIAFAELPIQQQDAYAPENWAISLVSESVDRTVAVRRGGYFLLPDDPVAYNERATIMIKDQSRRRSVELGWIIRVGNERRLTYANFAKAMADMHHVQKSIPFYMMSAITEKFAKYDGLKACFLTEGGTLRIDGKPAADASIGNCSVLKFDPAKTDSGIVIEFDGPLDIVTVVETSLYLPKST